MASPVLPTGYSARKLKEFSVPYNAEYATSATKEFEIGSIYETNDGTGKVFRYAKAGATGLAANLMGQAPAAVANHTNIALGGTAAVGATDVVVVTTLSTATTADQYAGGTLLINDATGEGQAYQIVSNTAGTTPTIVIAEGLKVALDATSEFTLVSNPWNGVIVAPTTKTAQHVGVTSAAVTAGYFYWAQVEGPVGILVDTGDTVVIGSPVGQPGTAADAGACGVPSITTAIWGVAQTPGTATEYALIDLSL